MSLNQVSLAGPMLGYIPKLTLNGSDGSDPRSSDSVSSASSCNSTLMPLLPLSGCCLAKKLLYYELTLRWDLNLNVRSLQPQAPDPMGR